jgi:small subunit ribosomal protein S8
MSFTDPIGDLITRLRNAQMIGRQEVSSPASKERANVLDVLKREGYIKDYGIREVRPGIQEVIVTLKYVDGAPVIGEITRVQSLGVGFIQQFLSCKKLKVVLEFLFSQLLKASCLIMKRVKRMWAEKFYLKYSNFKGGS